MESRDKNGHIEHRPGREFLCHSIQIRRALEKLYCNQTKRLQEQREWMGSYEQLKAWEEIVISFDDEEELTRQITLSNASGPSTLKRGRELSRMLIARFFSLECGK